METKNTFEHIPDTTNSFELISHIQLQPTQFQPTPQDSRNTETQHTSGPWQMNIPISSYKSSWQ